MEVKSSGNDGAAALPLGWGLEHGQTSKNKKRPGRT